MAAIAFSWTPRVKEYDNVPENSIEVEIVSAYFSPFPLFLPACLPSFLPFISLFFPALPFLSFLPTLSPFLLSSPSISFLPSFLLFFFPSYFPSFLYSFFHSFHFSVVTAELQSISVTGGWLAGWPGGWLAGQVRLYNHEVASLRVSPLGQVWQ